MRKYTYNELRIFLAPDDGTGGGSGASASASAQQQQQQQAGSTFVDPTAGLDLDDLEPSVREIIEKSRAGFASLQEQSKQAEQARLHEETQRKNFQSNFDRLQAQVQQLTGNGEVKTDDPQAQQLQKFEQILKDEGVPEVHAKTQAKLMLRMMSDYGAELKKEIGSDLRPFASSIVSREAQFAWDTAVASDKTGALAIPELAQQVWDQVQIMVQNGQQVTPQVVNNLTGMAYFTHLQNGGSQQQQQMKQQTQQFPNVGRLTFPGAGAAAARPIVRDANAPKYTLDPDTDAALQVVFGKWSNGQGGVKAPAYREPTKKGGR